jgi:hypothetical protein
MAITIVGQPYQIMPAYNPVVYYLNSNNVLIPGFRYLIQIYNAGTSTLLAEFKIAPRPTDNYGYVDCSKIVQSKVSSYLNNTSTFSPADTGSVYNYDIKFGEEYVATKTWQSYTFSTVPGFTTQTTINSTAHGYVVGDQIKLSTNVTYTDARQGLNGYFTVQNVINANSYIINLAYPGAFSGTTAGTSQYADNRIFRAPNLTSLLNRRVFNRAYSFENFPNYNQSQIILGTATSQILTNAPNAGFYIRPDQKLFWNFWDNKLNLCRRVIFQNDAGELYAISTSGTSSFVKQVNVANGAIVTPIGTATLPLVKSTTKYYDVWSTASASTTTQSSEKQRLYIDRECPINETQILFLDRSGSWSSFSFPLRQIETGNVTRDSYRKELGGLKNGAYTYTTLETGMTNWFISDTKSYTLNTSWMSDEMSVYFQELISSPQTYVKFDGSANYISCTITDTSYVVERAKNKKLIRKTINIRLANNDNINI